MHFRRFFTLIILTFTLASCGTGKQLTAPSWYTNPAPADTSKLRFDGFYSIISDPGYPRDKYSALDPVFFTSNNKIDVTNGARVAKDSALFSCKYYRKISPADLGRYIIEGDTISAFAPVVVALKGGALYREFNLHFTGTIVNKDSIANWKAIPPFPKRIKKRDIENSQNGGLFEERGLKLIPADSIKCLGI